MATFSRRGPSASTVTGEWECDECGYTRRGTLRNRPSRCPECGAPGDAFTFWSDDEEEEEFEDWDEEEEEWEEEEDWDEEEEEEEEF